MSLCQVPTLRGGNYRTPVAGNTPLRTRIDVLNMAPDQEHLTILHSQVNPRADRQ